MTHERWKPDCLVVFKNGIAREGVDIRVALDRSDKVLIDATDKAICDARSRSLLTHMRNTGRIPYVQQYGRIHRKP